MSTSISVLVNNEAKTIPHSTSIERLLEKLNVSKLGVAIAINRRVITKSNWADTFLQKNDKVSIIEATQGG